MLFGAAGSGFLLHNIRGPASSTGHLPPWAGRLAREPNFRVKVVRRHLQIIAASQVLGSPPAETAGWIFCSCYAYFDNRLNVLT